MPSSSHDTSVAGIITPSGMNDFGVREQERFCWKKALCCRGGRKQKRTIMKTSLARYVGLAAGGTGFDNEFIPDIASLVEQRAPVLIEIPVLLIQREAGIFDEDIELVVVA